MQKKILAFLLLGVGVIILLISLFADLIGIGAPGFGYKQGIGVVIGAIVGIIGLILRRKWAKLPEAKP